MAVLRWDSWGSQARFRAAFGWSKKPSNSSTVVGQIRAKLEPSTSVCIGPSSLDAAVLVLDTCPSGVHCTRERVSAVRVRRGRVEVVRVNYRPSPTGLSLFVPLAQRRDIQQTPN